MARLYIKKLRLTALQEDGKGLIDELQKAGITELSAVSDERLTPVDVSGSISSLDRNAAAAESCLEYMDSYNPPKSGLMSMFSGREEISEEAYDERSGKTDEYLKLALSVCADKKTIDNAKSELAKLDTAISALSAWDGLDIPMKDAGTSSTTAFVGTFAEKKSESALEALLEEELPDAAADVTVISSSPIQTAVCVICMKSDADAVWTVLREHGFTVPADPTKHPPAVRKKRLLDRAAQLKGEIKDAEGRIVEASARREDIAFLCDALHAKLTSYDGLSKMAYTDNTIVLEGYVPEERVAEAEMIADRHGAVLEVCDPDEEDDVPVALKNNDFNEPMESVLEMYSMPGKHDIDPSAVISFFYYVLFGLMLSDAGYGLVMTVFSAIVLAKKKVEGSMKKMLKMFFWSGISTMIWGVMFGSIFGDIIPMVCEQFFGITGVRTYLWFQPEKNPIDLLLFSLAIGVVHMLLGIITNAVIQWKQGHRFDAILDSVPIILLLVGAVPFGASIFKPVFPDSVTQIGLYVALVGAVLVVCTASRSSKGIIGKIGGGLYALYNTASGYLSDILSYSRLLALGLATGSIAGVINMMGCLPENKITKAILLVVVFIVGHLLNMAINLLGAYVHTMRLQFVELLPKFFEGGGRAFAPFELTTKYFKLRKEKSSDKKSA